MMDRRIVNIAFLAAIALTVTVILYALFDNYSTFENTSKGIKLGGSVAFFFILFTTEFTFMKNLYSDNLIPVREALAGKWECVAEVNNKETNQLDTYRGTADIQEGDGDRITIIGSVENHPETWEADEVVLTDSKLVYFFDVPMLKVSGVTSLRFAYKKHSPLNEMRGFWILSGQEGRGSVVFTRVS
jgi:hypothetical protein